MFKLCRQLLTDAKSVRRTNEVVGLPVKKLIGWHEDSGAVLWKAIGTLCSTLYESSTTDCVDRHVRCLHLKPVCPPTTTTYTTRKSSVCLSELEPRRRVANLKMMTIKIVMSMTICLPSTSLTRHNRDRRRCRTYITRSHGKCNQYCKGDTSSQWEKAQLPLSPNRQSPKIAHVITSIICPHATYGQDHTSGYFYPYSQSCHSFFFFISFLVCMQNISTDQRLGRWTNFDL